MKILCLSAYDANSHARWRSTLCSAFPQWDWTVLTLPPRYFSWRIRGNSLSWAFSERTVLEQRYDLVLATSMVDLSALRGLVPALTRCPTLVYFHENQFAYPTSDAQYDSVEPQILNLYTALAADYVLFNSDYNRRTFLAGAAELLQRLPDRVPAGLVQLLERRSAVLPVPLEDGCFAPVAGKPGSVCRIVWNHRWEYDKGPERLLEIVLQVAARGIPVEWCIVGQQFRRQPDVFERIRAVIEGADGQSLLQWGYVESTEDYRHLLATADIVLSTAMHDFQGLSVLEAVAAGCVPLVPRRLAYPEWFGEAYCYTSIEQDSQREASAAVELLAKWLSGLHAEYPSVPDLARFRLESLKARYQSVIDAVMAEWPSAG